MTVKTKTIDEYLAPLSPDKRAALEKLRKTIKAAVPEAEECISYGLAAFCLDGKPLVAFGASDKHCAFYPMSSTTVETLKDELSKYETSKGTIRFQANKPLPVALVRKLVKTRIAEDSARTPSDKMPTKKKHKHRDDKGALPAGLAAPARRALVAAGYSRLEQLSNVSEADLMKLHGMGPKAMAQIRAALSKAGRRSTKHKT